MTYSPEFRRLIDRALAAPRLTLDEEIALFDAGKHDELIRCNLRYAWHWAYRMRGYVSSSLEDLYQEACDGFVVALKTWDTSRRVFLRSWAWGRSMKNLYQRVLADWSIVQNRAHRRSSYFFTFRVRARQLVGQEDRIQMLMREFKRDETWVREALMATDASECAPIDLDWESRIVLPDPTPEDAILQQECIQVVREELEALQLDSADLMMFEQRFLTDEEEIPTWRVLGQAVGLSHEGARLRVNQTMLQLQRRLETRYGKEESSGRDERGMRTGRGTCQRVA